ncbi:amidohydrolase family protein [Flavivirga sp. 57AJ16]|uniref:amidohydrolase family protein n=1 Tax=Flavivirga sp. 57AJ16 TaxID=3025307 RepID=UPI0023657B22|nr:amidohydrolase family protein [Flavivirga sp. 57AJ16]MDD7884919.1 amidohydrolase family protein [Flavivirga sp. 57AJ16]
MKNLKTAFLLIIMLCASIITAQQTPAPKQTNDIAIIGATAHIGNGTIIKNSIIVIKNGKIDLIGDAEKSIIDLNAIETINAKGKHIYPGFIVPNSTLGLIEIDAVKASDDNAEMGSLNPHIRSLIAYNAESKVIETMRPNGVLLGQITPRGGRLSGTSSVVQFDAWNWEDAVIKTDEGLHLNWPGSFSRGNHWLGEAGLQPNKNYNKQIRQLKDYFNECKAYNSGNKTKIHLPFEAVQGIFDGAKKLYIHVNDEKGIIDAMNFAEQNNIKNMIVVGGREAYKVADLLNKNEVPVILQRVHSTPNNEDDDYDLPYKTAKLLVDQDVLVALETSGQMERMNTRNLPFYAGTTVTHGLTKEQALQLITLNPAKILGIDHLYGSLEKGKSATLFISEGDAMDMRTNKLTHAFIDGREISLETHQTELWKRYSEKYKHP